MSSSTSFTGNHVWVHPLVGVLLKIALTPGNRVILPRMKIVELEHSTDWQATAEDRNKRPIAVMRTNKGKYRLYNGNWTATPYPNSYQFPEGRATHSADEVEAMFASGKLKLLKGSIPAKT